MVAKTVWEGHDTIVVVPVIIQEREKESEKARQKPIDWRAVLSAATLLVVVVILALVVWLGSPQQAQALAAFLRALVGSP